MIAGFDTTATGLVFSTYVLATEPEVQKKLQQEIDENWQENESDYDSITNMTYMHLVVREVFRLYSFAGKVRIRECNEKTIVCGHQIEKGKRKINFYYLEPRIETDEMY
ncbi:unnamed protein product [Rotaria socialis]|uniref:Cytochrome P450 n=1 Tax=Rotaria socialis TaxID=392032 RepID=A0A820XVQ7_9BILA|nr:unnamed protein product [Rotaria socialis]CAF3416098.1 unnamed protein product [Rotaria socialis]CAF3477456.1 unnamed protein product [Rotaria socialis]CAF3552102.1 unnamed protein product [Rotaria socialis]CAF4296146.1 unnamed protein product [Rotaria socialis]